MSLETFSPRKNEASKEKLRGQAYDFLFDEYEHLKTPKDRRRFIRKFIQEATKYYNTVGYDAKPDFEILNGTVSFNNKEEYAERFAPIVDRVWEYARKYPKIAEEADRVNYIRDGKDKFLSKTLIYELVHSGATVRIHLLPARTLSVGEKLADLKLGMQTLADVVSKNPAILKIEAISWIVSTKPELIKRLGFTIVRELDPEEQRRRFKWEEKTLSVARMSRGTLLDKWLKTNVDEKKLKSSV